MDVGELKPGLLRIRSVNLKNTVQNPIYSLLLGSVIALYATPIKPPIQYPFQQSEPKENQITILEDNKFSLICP